MEIIAIPEALGAKSLSDIQLIDHRSEASSKRVRINLTKNVISFLQQGRKEVVTNDRSVVVGGQTFLMMKSGKCLMTETISANQQQYNSLLLFFSNQLLLEFIEKHSFDLSSHTMNSSFMVLTYDAYIQQYVQSLNVLKGLNRQLKEQLLKVKFEELMTYLIAQNGSSFLHFLLGESNYKTVHLTQVVENNKLTKLTVQELAFLCNMSVSTFKRAFLKQYNTSPIKWFQTKRLEHAAFLLQTQKQSSEIYELAGYENLSNFIQAFKRKYGCTPKQYQGMKMNV